MGQTQGTIRTVTTRARKNNNTDSMTMATMTEQNREGKMTMMGARHQHRLGNDGETEQDNNKGTAITTIAPQCGRVMSPTR